MMSSSRALLDASVSAPPSCSGSNSATTICAGRGPPFHKYAQIHSGDKRLRPTTSGISAGVIAHRVQAYGRLSEVCNFSMSCIGKILVQ